MMEKVSINGYVLDTTTEEDHKRAMLHAVFDALDMDIEKELHIYRISKEKESYTNKEEGKMIFQNKPMEVKVEAQIPKGVGYKKELKEIIACLKECEEEHNGSIRCTLFVTI